MIHENRRQGFMVLAIIFSLSFVFLLWHGCGGGGGGSDSPPTPTKSVFIKGTVPGTVAIAYDTATGKEATRNVASGTPKTFSLNVAPGDYYLMFIENEGTPTQRNYSFQNVTGANVFTCKANTTLNLGILVFDNLSGTAKPQTDPISGNDNVTETVIPPADFSGVWTATRKFVNSTCSGHSPGTTVTDNVTIAQGFGIVTFSPAGTTETAIGVPNTNTVILTEYWQSAPYSALITLEMTKQSDGSLAGNYSKVGYGGECSESGTITAVRSTPGKFTAEMLAGKVFFREFPVGDLFEFSLFFFNSDFSFRNESSTNALNPAVEILNGTWSIDGSGRMIVKIPGFPQDVIGTLLSDSPTEMQISVEGIDDPGIEIFQKTVGIETSKIPGTYTEPDGTAIINPGGTGSFIGINSGPFTWSVAAGILTITTPNEKNIAYALASSSSTATSYTILKLVGEELNLDGSVHNIFKVELTRNP